MSDDLKEKVKQKLDQIASDYSDKSGVKIDTMVSKGKIYEQINDVAEMISVDLIVMGTNGSKGSNSTIIGSNAEKSREIIKMPCNYNQRRST